MERALRGETIDWQTQPHERAKAGMESLLVEAAGDEQMQPKMRRLAALEAAVINRRMVLLGDLGSGKTTFVNHLASSCHHA